MAVGGTDERTMFLGFDADAHCPGSPRLKSIEGLLKYAGISKYFALPVLVPAYSVLFAKVR